MGENPSKGMDNDLCNSGDVLAHEYIHLVTQQKLNWYTNLYRNIEWASVEEAYSDILGELSEPNPDWKIGTGLY